MDLPTALRANAAFTGTCGAACLTATAFVTAHAAVPDRLWTLGLGAMLLAYVPMLLFAAARPDAWLVRTIIALDWGYVAIATAFFVRRWQQMDGLGLALVVSTTLLVALFAIIQQRGLTAVSREARP
jgi:hypothetical protein